MLKLKEESSIGLYWVLRIVLLPIPILLAYFLWLLFFDPNSLNESGQLISSSQLWLPKIIGFIILIEMVVICIRLARIEYSWSGLTAFRNGKKTHYRWSEVSRVLKVPFWTPPIYRVSFTNGDPPIYFGMSWWTISIVFSSKSSDKVKGGAFRGWGGSMTCSPDSAFTTNSSPNLAVVFPVKILALDAEQMGAGA